MRRLNKYNQIILSLVGTGLLIVLLIMAYQFLEDAFYRSPYIPEEKGLVSQQQLDSLKKLNLRSQVISMEKIQLFDSATQTYLLPISHINLDNPESRSSAILGIMDTEIYEDEYYPNAGHYNNLVLYNFSNNKTDVLLNTRVNIDNYAMFKSKNRKLIVFTGWDNDTNGDGNLNRDDFKKAFIYDDNLSSVRQVKNDQFVILSYEYLWRSETVLFKVVEAKSDIKEKYDRPVYYMYYSFEDNTLKPLINKTVLKQLQEIIDN